MDKKILLIHPNDSTTLFAKRAYEHESWTIINVIPSKSALRRLIKSHDIIIMLGHGNPFGLLNPNNGKYGSYIIDSRLVDVLRGKFCAGIWCYSTDFFKKYGLIGYSLDGTFITDLNDYYYAFKGLLENPLQEINASNELFVDSLFNNFLNPDKIIEKYIDIDNPIVEYNRVQITKHS